MALATNFSQTELNGDIQCPCKKYKMDNDTVTVVLGAQWGDEGKGKVVDMLASETDIVCRCQVIFFSNLLVILTELYCFSTLVNSTSYINSK